MIVLKKKKILLSLCFTKGKFPLKENSRNLIFKNVARITERMMDEARHSLIHFTERATTSTSLKSSWNNPNSYHMAVLETFPPHANGEINANDVQINFPPPPLSLQTLATTDSKTAGSRYQIRGNSKSAKKNILARTIFPRLLRRNANEPSNAVLKGEIEETACLLHDYTHNRLKRSYEKTKIRY